jgi:hypothetical protein
VIQACEQAYTNEQDGKHVDNVDNERLVNVARFDAIFNHYLVLSTKGEFSDIDSVNAAINLTRRRDLRMKMYRSWSLTLRDIIAPSPLIIAQVIERNSRETGRYQRRVHERTRNERDDTRRHHTPAPRQVIDLTDDASPPPRQTTLGNFEALLDMESALARPQGSA